MKSNDIQHASSFSFIFRKLRNKNSKRFGVWLLMGTDVYYCFSNSFGRTKYRFIHFAGFGSSPAHNTDKGPKHCLNFTDKVCFRIILCYYNMPVFISIY